MLSKTQATLRIFPTTTKLPYQADAFGVAQPSVAKAPGYTEAALLKAKPGQAVSTTDSKSLTSTLAAISFHLKAAEALTAALLPNNDTLPNVQNKLGSITTKMPCTELQSQKEYKPAVRLVETLQCTVLTVALAGVEEKDIQISLKGNELMVSGIKSAPLSDATLSDGYRLGQAWSGAFKTAIKLSFQPQKEQIQVQFLEGTLTINIAKPVFAHTQTIKITTLN